MPQIQTPTATISVVGWAQFNMSTGAITNLVMAGCITNVTYQNTAFARIFHNLGHTNYAISVIATDDNVAATCTELIGTRAGVTSSQFDVCAPSPGSATHNPSMVMIIMVAGGV